MYCQGQEMDSCHGMKCESETQQLSDKAKILIGDIQEILPKFQLASRGNRTAEINFLVEQVLQLLGNLKTEINASCPASPIPVSICRF